MPILKLNETRAEILIAALIEKLEKVNLTGPAVASSSVKLRGEKAGQKGEQREREREKNGTGGTIGNREGGKARFRKAPTGWL